MIEERFVTAPEGFHLRVCLGATPRVTPTGTEPTDERYVEIAVSRTAEERGTAVALLRGSAAAIQSGLAQPNLPGLALRLVHELWRAARWTDVILTADHHQARPLAPTPSALAARTEEISTLLEGAMVLPPPWVAILSPPLPATWPLGPGSSLVTYAAASRPSDAAPHLIEIARPFARVVSDPLCVAAPSLERLSPALEPVGTAAVRPLQQAELERIRAMPALDVVFASIAAGEPVEDRDEIVRARLTFFRARASWLYEAVCGSHAALFEWLDAPV